MAFTGQPTPSTIINVSSGKISDGKSVRLTAAEEVAQGNFYQIGGFFGLANQDAAVGEEVVLAIEQAEYETNQIKTDEEFAVGTSIYFDAASKVLTETVGTNKKVGIVSSAKDSNNVIWFVLGPQV